MSAARTLPSLQAALSRRYPGLKVAAYVQEFDEREPFRTISFEGPLAALLAHGVATELPNGKLRYEDGLGTEGGGGLFRDNTAYIFHHLVIEGETATPSLPRKFPTKKLEADVRRICKRLATAND